LTLLVAVLLTTGGLVSLIGTATAQTNPPGWQSSMIEVVVELDPSENPDQYATYFLSRLYVPASSHKARINHVYEHTIVGFSVYLTPGELAMAQRTFAAGEMGVQVLMAAPEMAIPDPTWFGSAAAMRGTPLKGSGVIVPTGLERIEVPLPETPGQYADVDVAVIDTGVDKLHPQLNVVGGVDCTATPAERDNYGYDGYGHGTHVAGTIGATWSVNGIVGVAPGARIWDVRVLDDNDGGSLASSLSCVDWVVG